MTAQSEAATTSFFGQSVRLEVGRWDDEALRSRRCYDPLPFFVVRLGRRDGFTRS